MQRMQVLLVWKDEFVWESQVSHWGGTDA